MKLIPTDLNEQSIQKIFFPPVEQCSCVPDSVVHFVQKHFQKGDSLLVALSGGADSVALLLMLKRLSVAVGAFYLNHQIRDAKETQGEALFVQALCRAYEIPLCAESLPEGFLIHQAKQQGVSLEALARQIRYNRFKTHFYQGNYDWMATAHHLDDQMETQVMRFLGGASVRGLGGIHAISGKLVRPLLECKKEEILNWLEQSSLPYLVDSTNASPCYLRNRIRLELMPQLKRLFLGFETSLSATALKMELQAECNDFYLKQAHLSLCEKEDLSILDWHQLRSLPMALQVEALIQALSQKRGKGAMDQEEWVIPWKMVFQSLSRPETAYGVNRELFSFEGWGAKITFYQGKKGVLIAKKGGNGFEASLCTSQNLTQTSFPFSEQHIPISIDQWEKATDQTVVAQIRWHRGTINLIVSTQFPVGEGVALPLDFLAGKNLLSIRSWQWGDQIANGKGSHRLKKIFNSWKLSKEAKAFVPVIEVDGEIVALLGSSQGGKEVIAQSCRRTKEEPTDKWIRILFEKCCLLLE